MRKLLVIAGLIALATSLARAADMPAKAPVYKGPPQAVVAYNWSGFYVGGNIGYSWGKAHTDVDVSAVTGRADIPGATFSDSNRLKGIIGGGQIGFNLQNGSWVTGLEADWQASNERGRATHSTAFSEGFGLCPFLCGFTDGTVGTHYEARILWFGTVRGRAGYASNGWLVLWNRWAGIRPGARGGHQYRRW